VEKEVYFFGVIKRVLIFLEFAKISKSTPLIVIFEFLEIFFSNHSFAFSGVESSYGSVEMNPKNGFAKSLILLEV